jgi:glycosyltransferase involved in cell wall biosynthesis
MVNCDDFKNRKGDFKDCFGVQESPENWIKDRVRRRSNGRTADEFAKLVRSETYLLENKMAWDGEWEPVQVTMNQASFDWMKTARSATSHLDARINKMKEDFWKKVPINRWLHKGAREVPRVSVALVSLVDTRFPNLISRLQEIKQDDPAFEIVITVAEPGKLTNENWLKLKEECEKLPNPVQVLFSDNNNISHNRNLAAMAAKGTENIIFLDDDVRLVKSPLTKLIEALDRYECLGVVSIPSYSESEMLKFKKPMSSVLKFWCEKELAITNIVAGMVMATRAKIVQATPFVTLLGNAGDDIHFMRQVHLLGYLGGYIFPDDDYVIDEDMEVRATRWGPLVMNTILEEGLIAICDKGIKDYGKDKLDLAVLKFWYASIAKNKDLKPFKPETQASIKEFWERFHAALSDFLRSDETYLDFRVRLADPWEKRFGREIEAARMKFETGKKEVVKFTTDQGELMRRSKGVTKPSLGALGYQLL